MAMELTFWRVLGVAERMERAAACFYRRAAGRCDDPKLCTLFVELAQWEKGHAQTFAEMKARLLSPVGEGRVRSFEIGCPPPAEAPSSRVFGACDDPSKHLPARPTKADVLELAIRKEEQTIVYYTGLREFVPGPDNIEVIEEIIEEEKRHVRILTQSLETLNRRPSHPYETNG